RKVIITEDIVRQALHLDDAKSIDCLPNEEIFVELARMGYEKPLTKLTFYKAFFSAQRKFLIHTILQYGGLKETGIKDLLGGEVSTMMSPRGSIVASFENGESFFAVHTPPDHLIRTNLEQKGVVPKIVFHIFEKLV
nr:hypothetical protein [Tanacetum cinerariifolium]